MRTELLIEKKTVLIVWPFAFSLGWRGAAPRVMDLATELASRGWNLILLHELVPWPVDFSAQVLAFPGKVLHTPFSGACWPLLDGHKFLRRLNRTLWRLGGRSYYNQKVELGWAGRVVPWVARNWSVEPPDVLWAVTSNNIAGGLAAQGLGA